MKLKRIILFFIVISFFLFMISFFIPFFELKNDTGYVGGEYVPNLTVYNAFTDLSNKIVISDNVDNNKIGEYTIKCKMKLLFFTISKTFKVKIVDKDNPIISLSGNNPSYVCPLKDYNEEGYSATDNYDGDITDKVNIIKKDDAIVYTVTDSSGNISSTSRTIIFNDEEKPNIVLNGNNTMTVYLGNNFYEPGYTASDNCDGDITNNVITTGTVDTSRNGNYTIEYKVSDSNGNITTVNRTVIVKSKPNYYGNGNIYLTFDDGPSYLTNEILDILDDENVKVTFFVTNADPIIKRAYDSGHTIALHSYTHDYSYIYASSENFFNDLDKISNGVYNIIGIKPNIIRFPGGSSNTVSRNYNKGIMSYLTTEVVNRGYIYFDWNVDSNDAGRDIYNSQNIYYNVINNLSHNKTNIVLMHDSQSHRATVDALRNIISFGKEYGYTFKAITSDTPLVVHGVNN